MNYETKENLLLVSTITLSILLGFLLTTAYDNYRMNEYQEDILLTAQEVIDTCKYNYNQDYKIIELEDKYLVEVEDE